MNATTGMPRLDMQDTCSSLESIWPLVLEFLRGIKIGEGENKKMCKERKCVTLLQRVV